MSDITVVSIKISIVFSRGRQGVLNRQKAKPGKDVKKKDNQEEHFLNTVVVTQEAIQIQYRLI